MNLLLAAAELSPWTPPGPVNEWMGGLGEALRARGHSVACVVPRYRWLVERIPEAKLTNLRLRIPLGKWIVDAPIWQGCTENGLTVWMVERDEFFDRSHLYGNEAGDYADNASRFIFFAKAVIELAKHVDPLPEVIHVHDWATGLVPVLARAGALPFRTVLSIHDLRRQGSFWSIDFDLTNLPGEWFSPGGVEFYGRLNLLKGGILMANQIVADGTATAENMLHAPAGHGLEAVLAAHQFKLHGVVGGLEWETWDPANDPELDPPLDPEDPAPGKREARKRLVRELGLDGEGGPFFAWLSPLTTDTGADVLVAVVREFLERRLVLGVHGWADPFYERYFTELAREFPGKLACSFKPIDDGFSRRLLAGADFLLMPAAWEGAGGVLFRGLRSGALPIARSLGIIADILGQGSEALGFLFDQPDAKALLRAADTALASPNVNELRKRAMLADFSWDACARRMEPVYRRALTVLPQPQKA
jgi:starch synthase